MYIYIRSMSESQTEIYRQVSDRSDTILEHIIKLMLYPNATSRDHWKAEIYAALNRVKKLRNNNKLPKAKLIYKALSSYNDVIDNIIRQVEVNEHALVSADISEDAILAIAVAYQTWLADELSAKGAIGSDVVFNKLDELIN